MEEVWKDINLASLNDQNTRAITTRSTFTDAILQDFLTRPFNIDPPKNMLSSSSSISSECAVSPPQPPLVTALSLSSRPDFQFDPLKTSHSLIHPHHNIPKNVSSLGNPSPFDQISNVAFTPSFPCFGNKRCAEPSESNSVGDRRSKRMIKNRESAARSRARKQAYTNELEQKVQLLAEENARLKRQEQELWEASSSGQQKKKSSLYRTSTAPF